MIYLNTDGGARGNPGPAAIGVVLIDDKGSVIYKGGRYIGKCTNNEAEYSALIFGMKKALERECTEIACALDSELVVNQLNGIYRVKNARMLEFYSQVRDLQLKFKSVSFKHILRAKNSIADFIVNKILDAEQIKKNV